MSLYYRDEFIELHHGDLRDVDVWHAADVMVTDPPYGVHHAKHGDNSVAIRGEKKTGRSSTRVIPKEHLVDRDTALTLWGKKPAMVFGSWRAPRPEGTMMRLIWDKQMIGMGGVGLWRPSDEEIYLLNWPNPKRRIGANNGSIMSFPALRGSKRPDHPTPKPIGLMRMLLERSPDGVVIDPFAGSGATLLAARELGRKSIGIEIEEKYCELIAKRADERTAGQLHLFSQWGDAS